ncbi:MAG: hypothetical protein AAFM91_09900 [Pseudomonadota bacterium]
MPRALFIAGLIAIAIVILLTVNRSDVERGSLPSAEGGASLRAVASVTPPQPTSTAGEIAPEPRYCQSPTARLSFDASTWHAPDNDTLRAAAALLAKSDRAEELAIAALLAPVGLDAIALLDRAIDARPRDPVLRMLSVQLCKKRQKDQPGQCGEGQLERRISDWLAVDAGNAAPWAERAELALRDRRYDRAADALANAAAASDSDIYFIDLVLRIDAALVVAGLPFQERVSQAFALTAALPSATAITTCREAIVEAEFLRSYCLEYYATQSKISGTFLDKMIGLGMQIELLDGQPTMAQHQAELQTERSALRQRFNETIDAGDIEAAMLADSSIFYAYAEQWQQSSELEAREVMVQEVERLNALHQRRVIRENCDDTPR